MQYQKFLSQLIDLYENWGIDSVQPKSNQFDLVIEKVSAMTTTNVMQLLNFAVSCIERDEIYCEIGCGLGANLIGSLLGNPNQIACAVDNFSDSCDRTQAINLLLANLANFNLEDRVNFFCQEFTEFFRELREYSSSERIGVYFYNGSHDYRSQLLGLLLVKPFLSEQALIILTHSNSSSGQQANWDFMAANPECKLVLDLSTPYQHHPTFWNGIQVMTWDINRDFNYDWLTFIENRNESLIQNFYRWELQVEQKKEDAEESLLKEADKLQEMQLFDEAENKYKEILNVTPNKPNVWYKIGILYYITERHEEAIASLSKAIEINPAKPDYYYSLGLVLEKIGNIPPAAIAYQKAIAIDSNFVDAYNNLGNIMFAAGEISPAEELYLQAISANQNHFGSYLNWGNLLLITRQIDRAITAYETALQLQPNDLHIQKNLELAKSFQQDSTQAYLYAGHHFYQAQKYQEAIQLWQKFLETKTGDTDLYIMLADCYDRIYKYEEAIAIYRQAIDLYPNVASLYYSLIKTLGETGQTQELITVATQASDLFPNELYFKFCRYLTLPIIYQNSEQIEVYRRQFMAGLNDLIAEIPLQTSTDKQLALNAIDRHTNFFLACQGYNDLDIQKQYGNWVHQIVYSNYPQWNQPLQMPPKNDKIRVGYLSGCLWGHTVGKLTLGWLRHHNLTKLEIYSYHINETQDEYTKKFKLYSDKFYQITNNLQAVCEQIIADNLHILVFLDIGQQPEMTRLAALRLAPIQCTTWAHPVTSGLPTIDYFLSSELMEPTNAKQHYSEQLILLPNIGISYAKPNIPALTKHRSHFQLRDDAVVYLCCQTFFKYLPSYDEILAAIAQRVPQAQFAFISRPNPAIAAQFRQRLQQAFSNYNLHLEDYAIILPALSQTDYWNLNLVADIFLDSFAWSGGHTALEAIACNLPIVTYPDDLMRGRHSYGILKMLGITDTIAQNPAEYIEIAARLGLDPDWRNSIVQQTIAKHPSLYDDLTCVHALEEFYHRIVANHQ